MKSARLALVAAGWAAACFVAGPGTAGEPVRGALNARIFETDLKADSLRLHLPDGWVVPGSIVATAAGETLRGGTDYELDPAEGIIRLTRPRPGEHLRVLYEIVPLEIGRVFQRTIPLDTAGTETVRVAPRQENIPPATSRARLDLRGTKTVSLEIGSGEDLTLRQSLDVSMSGEIVSGVTVRGVLSDRQTPLQAEGQTTELSDVDRVYLQVDGPGASLTLGDFALRGPAGLFTGYQRQLEGVTLQGKRGKAGGSVAAATLPGSYTTVEFQAEEGKQGPYHLLSRQASLEGVIQSGSERVWIDGDLLVRGEDRDYVIDYAAGTLIFTGRRVVGKDSRVTVDFQANANPYRRNAYAATFGWNANHGPGESVDEGRFLLRGSLLVERDDPSRPVGGALSERERQALRAAGDSLTGDLAPGIDCGSVGYGDYKWAEADSLPFAFLRYAGADSGSCRVRFADAGDGKGDYADSLLDDGMTIYHFVGVKRGRFSPGRAVARPGERDLLDFLAAWSGPSGLRFEAEGAGSFDDPNLLSAKDDSDREGGALRLAFARDTLPLRLGGRNLGRWGFSLESRDLGPTFRPVGRIDSGWYGYDWGIKEGRLARGDRRRSASLRQEPGLGFAWEGGYETLSNRRDLDGERNKISLRRTGRLHGSLERIRASTTDRESGSMSEGRRVVDGYQAGLRLAWLESGAGFRRERQELREGDSLSGRGFDEWRISAALPIPADRGRIEVEQTFRTDQEIRDAGWQTGDRARTWEARAAWTPPGRILDGRYARRDLLRRAGGTVRSDIAGLIWSEDRPDGRLGQQVRADLNTTEEEGRVKAIEYAGPGRGRYDSLGVYVGEGDYDVVLLPTGESGILRRFDATWRVEGAPGRGRDERAASLPSRLWLTSQWLLQASFSSRTTGSAASFWGDIPQLLLARRRGVPLAQHRVRAELSVLPRARWLSPQARIERERSESQRYENAQTGRMRDQVSLTLRSTPWTGWTLEQEAQVEREEERDRLLGGRSAEGKLGWRSARLRLGETWRPGPSWTLRFGTIGRVRERIPTAARYEIYSVVPGAQWLPRTRSRLDLQLTRTWVRGPATRLLGLERSGWEGRGSLGLRLRRWLEASLIADLRAPDRSTTRVNGRAEMKAFF